MILLLLCTYLGYSLAAKSNPEVTTTSGVLRGSVLQTRNGRDYFAFTKIPFAKPPLGNLRFKDPVSPEPWEGVLDASKPNPPCYQLLKNATIGTEDCLYLNVFTPKMNESFPVMIYFFGGGWRMGMPGPSSVARYFMDEDIVLVMINYRVGALGFLSTEDEKIPGNMGLKDMVAALEWTNHEISNFGGNPNLITAFGFSAGAASAHYLCSIPRTRGCISQSGVGGSHWSLRKPGDAKTTAHIIAKTVGCTPENILSCLQSKTSEEITKTESKLKFWIDEPLIIHGPVLEKEHTSALLTEWPLLDTNFPWLTGVTTREGLFKSFGLNELRDKPIMAEFKDKKEDYLKRMLNLPKSSTEAVKKIFEKFFINSDVVGGIEKLYTEGYFVYPALHELKNHQGPKYFYVFNITGGPSIWEMMKMKKFNISSGVAHGDDSQMFFDTSFLSGDSLSIMSQPDRVKISQQLIKLWVNFAKYQKPTVEGEKLNWPQFDSNGKYLYLSNDKFITKEYDYMTDILDFWDRIFTNSDEVRSPYGSDEL